MSEGIEPLDPADAKAIAEGVIAPEDARPVDEFDTDTGLDIRTQPFNSGSVAMETPLGVCTGSS